MKPVIDPVWPWSHLWSFLAPASPPVLLAALLAALVAFALPILWQLRPAGLSRRQLTAGAGLALVLLLGYVVRDRWGSSAGLTALPALAGLTALLLAPPALAGLSVATYLGVPGTSGRRIAAIVSLRLLAFLLALLAILRPALGFSDRNQPRTQLWLALDCSRSMTIKDESGKRSRWEHLLKSLEKAAPLLQQLRDGRQMDVRFFKFAGEVSDFDPENPGEADGKHTDYGAMLRGLLERRDGRSPMRGLLVIGDGTDHGIGTPALAEAARWRNLPCPVSTFACGNPATSSRQNDVAITSITTRPTPFVPVKGKLTVRVTIDARGYEGTEARVRLYLEGQETKGGKSVTVDREVKAQDATLHLTTGNEVEITTNAPATPGEVKVKVVVETREPDQLPANNVIETFVTVSKEGISVLLVDKQRSHEPQRICDALSDDPRIRVTPVWLRSDRAIDEKARDLFRFDEQAYDVIILGDVTARQVRAVDPQALVKIRDRVAGGAGLLMLGGYASLGNGDWKGTEIEPLLPIDLGVGGQEESPVRMVPTADGLRRAPYILRLDEGKDPKAAWDRLARLDGYSVLQLPNPRRGLETVLATTVTGEPLLVMQNYGKGGAGGKPARTLAFGGDTTNRWERDEKSMQLHHRFWQRLVVWLARQEDAEGSVWVKPDVRRLPLRNELGFQVGLRGKGGGPDLKGGTYKVTVVAPGGVRTAVPVSRGAVEGRGVFPRTDVPGVYRIEVEGKGKDPSGGVVSGRTSARVIVYDDDLELTRTAADHDFLRKLASAGGGEFHRVEGLAAFLNELYERPPEQGRLKLDLWPDWRRTTRSGFLVGFFLAFVLAVSCEWVLRRRWGLV